MAIDDNTSYELTGYQVKDLAGRIRLKADASAIPTVNDATLTIQHNGSSVQTFTANQSANATANIETIYSVDVSSAQPVTQVVSTAMIQDEAVTTAKIDDGAVTAAKTAFGGNYSTTEVSTGFTWIDGKTIYKKTFHVSAGPGAGQTIHITGLTSIDNVVNYEGFLSTSVLTIYVGTARANSNSALGCWFERDYGRFAVESGGSDRSGFDGYVTLYYTKSS